MLGTLRGTFLLHGSSPCLSKGLNKQVQEAVPLCPSSFCINYPCVGGALKSGNIGFRGLVVNGAVLAKSVFFQSAPIEDGQEVAALDRVQSTGNGREGDERGTKCGFCEQRAVCSSEAAPIARNGESDTLNL
uniref:Uncharacterized protein n=1 Tax=Steinernema glaseri TaxID=37863 RepID=A0A1I7Z939_9BILA